MRLPQSYEKLNAELQKAVGGKIAQIGDPSIAGDVRKKLDIEVTYDLEVSNTLLEKHDIVVDQENDWYKFNVIQPDRAGPYLYQPTYKIGPWV